MNSNATILAAFVPCDDITSYELALVVANVGMINAIKHGVIFPESAWEELDTRIKRHFMRAEPVAQSDQQKNLQGMQ